MSKLLSILIPVYTESDHFLNRLLNTIAMQQHINFSDIEVLVESDGDEKIYEESFFTPYPFDISYSVGRKRGVSATRNDLLDKAIGEYVIWCDADDYWCSTFGLYVILCEICKEKFDVLKCDFVQETPDPNNKEGLIFPVLTGDINNPYVHNKTYRREFLLSNEIRFCEKSNIHEDTAIYTLSSVYTKNIRYNQSATYCWSYNADSICRNDPYYIQHTLKYFIMTNSYIIEHLLKHGKDDNASQISVGCLIDSYYYLNDPKWIEKSNNEYLSEIEGYIKHFLTIYKEHIDNFDNDIKQQIIKGKKIWHTQQIGLGFEKITFDSWLKHIEEDAEPIDFHVNELFDKA